MIDISSYSSLIKTKHRCGHTSDSPTYMYEVWESELGFFRRSFEHSLSYFSVVVVFWWPNIRWPPLMFSSGRSRQRGCLHRLVLPHENSLWQPWKFLAEVVRESCMRKFVAWLISDADDPLEIEILVPNHTVCVCIPNPKISYPWIGRTSEHQWQKSLISTTFATGARKWRKSQCDILLL